MSDKVKSKKQRAIYYSLIAVMVLAIGLITVIAVAQNNKSNDLANKDSNSVSDSNSTSDQKPDESSKPDPTPGDEDKPNNEDTPNTPVVEVVSFIMPVVNGTLIKEYTDNTIVYSSTLGIYTGHMGMDFAGAEGAQVVAVYKGTVSEITTSYLTGTTVVVDHGNGIKTVYNSIEVNESLKQGDKVEKGSVLGVISTNNKQEYKDGAHLHFEVFENNEKISPLKYLTVEEK